MDKQELADLVANAEVITVCPTPSAMGSTLQVPNLLNVGFETREFGAICDENHRICSCKWHYKVKQIFADDLQILLAGLQK